MLYKRLISSIIFSSFLWAISPALASDIFVAIRSGKMDDLSAAVKKDPSKINMPEKNGGAPPLFAAIDSGSTAAVEILLKNGADANIKNKNNYTPLKLAECLMNENLKKYASPKYPATASTIVGILKKHWARK